MRHLVFVMLVPACVGGPPTPNPPLLHVTSPQRSSIQDQAGQLVVTGTVAPNPDGAAVSRVVVNGVPAALAGDGSFQAAITIAPGATLIHTVASDAGGGTATDTRSVEAGELRAPGSNIEKAVAVSISAPAIAKLGDAASHLIATADLSALVAPLNPIVHSGDENGPDCLYAQAFIDHIQLSGAKLALSPVTGGLQLSAELDGVDVTGHAKFAVSCVNGQSNFEITATSIALAGTLAITANGMNGFAVQLANPAVQLTGLQITATGIPAEVLQLIPLDQVLSAVAPAAAQQFLGPMINRALGTLTAPQQVSVLGQTIDFQVAPSSVAFDPAGGTVVLDMKLLIEGSEHGRGFTFTPNGTPTLDPGAGLALAIADDLANEALSEMVSTGLLDLTLAAHGDGFDAVQLTPTSPPMISADPSDGKLRLILPDMLVTFTNQGSPTTQLALNAQVDVAISPVGDGSSIAIDLGTPAIAIDPLDSVTPVPAGAGSPIDLGTSGQLGSITSVLQTIPLPQVAGLTLADTSVTGDLGYLVVKTTLR